MRVVLELVILKGKENGHCEMFSARVRVVKRHELKSSSHQLSRDWSLDSLEAGEQQHRTSGRGARSSQLKTVAEKFAYFRLLCGEVILSGFIFVLIRHI